MHSQAGTVPIASARPLDRLVLWVANALIYLRHPRHVRQFRWRVGYFPNAARPTRYSEKMLWRKLFDRNPLFVTFSDKLATKALQARLTPSLGLAEILWTGKSAAEIPGAALQRPVAIKASHGCDYSLFRRTGAADGPLKPRQVRRIDAWMRRAYGQHLLEWAYRHAGRRLFVEALIVPPPGEDLLDLSVHAADGVPLFIEAIAHNKTAQQRKGYFHSNGTRWPELEPVRQGPNPKPPLPADAALPACYREALAHALRLSAGVDYLRVDFLVAGGRLYGGEIAVYPGSGLARDSEFATYNALLAARWDLRKSWFLTTPQRGPRRLYAEAIGRSLQREGAGA
jgi:hypothetical protein